MRFFDAHCDAVMNGYNGSFDFVAGEGRGHMDLPRLLAAGHRIQLFAVFASARYFRGRDVRELGERAIGAIHEWAAASAGRLRVLRNGGDVAAAFRDEGYLGALIGLEGADPLEGQADNLARFHELGVRLVIPAWDDNPFAGTSGGDGAGFSAEGFRLLEAAEALHVMLDVSHLSDQGFDELLRVTRRPFVASHSNCRAISPAPRNLTDAQIRALAERGGVMGINLAPDFLDPDYHAAWDAVMEPVRHADAATRQRLRAEAGPALAAIPRPPLSRIADHVRRAIDIGGEDCIGLGGDLDGISFMPAGVTGVESYPQIPDMLRDAGLSERQVEKVCWRNMARVFEEVLG